jgi:hypothetical protein
MASKKATKKLVKGKKLAAKRTTTDFSIPYTQIKYEYKPQ